MFLFLVSFCLSVSVSPAFAATYTVTKTADTNDGTCDSDCSLREAIVAANANAGADTIEFDIPTSDAGYRDYDNPDTPSSGDSDGGDDYWTIRPTSAFPDLASGGLTIDGSTQTANQGDTNTYGPEIEIDALNAGDMAASCVSWAGKGLFYSTAGSSSFVFKSLVINSVQKGNGIAFCGSSGITVSVTQSYIGVDVKGEEAKPNTTGGSHQQRYGVGIAFIVTNNNTITIGGESSADRNVISGNEGTGISFDRGGNSYNPQISVVIKNNYIGTDRTGMQDLGNGFFGINLGNVSNTTVNSNLISGNVGGIYLGAIINVTISNNIIGLNADQTAAIETGTFAYPGIDWRNWSTDGTVANNLIDGNIIGGLKWQAISNIHYPGSVTAGTISNNIIGTDSTKTKHFPNMRYGMVLGRYVGEAHTNNLIVEGNTITNTIPRWAGEGNGIIVDASRGVILRNNNVYNNSNKGIIIRFPSAQVEITGNAIYGNAGLGVDLNNDGITANDSGDTDTGPNDLMNYPVITSVTHTGKGGYTVKGTLDGNSSESPFTIELCKSSSTSTGVGDCRESLTTFSTTGGDWEARVTVSDEPTGCARFSALATNSNGSTSEFSYIGMDSSACNYPVVPLGKADILANEGAVTEKHSLISIVGENTFSWDVYLAVGVTPKTGAFRITNTLYWQASDIYEVWFKSFFNDAKVLETEFKKPAIIALRYTPEAIEPILPIKNLKLAYSQDKLVWKVLANSVHDPINKTVSVVTKQGGYYMLVSGYPQQAQQTQQVQGVKTQEKEKKEEPALTPTPIPTPTPTPVVEQSSQTTKRCFLFWCW